MKTAGTLIAYLKKVYHLRFYDYRKSIEINSRIMSKNIILHIHEYTVGTVYSTMGVENQLRETWTMIDDKVKTRRCESLEKSLITNSLAHLYLCQSWHRRPVITPGVGRKFTMDILCTVTSKWIISWLSNTDDFVKTSILANFKVNIFENRSQQGSGRNRQQTELDKPKYNKDWIIAKTSVRTWDLRLWLKQ